MFIYHSAYSEKGVNSLLLVDVTHFDASDLIFLRGSILDHHYGRTVLMIGITFQYAKPRILKACLEFLRENYEIRKDDFLSFCRCNEGSDTMFG